MFKKRKRKKKALRRARIASVKTPPGVILGHTDPITSLMVDTGDRSALRSACLACGGFPHAPLHTVTVSRLPQRTRPAGDEWPAAVAGSDVTLT